MKISKFSTFKKEQFPWKLYLEIQLFIGELGLWWDEKVPKRLLLTSFDSILVLCSKKFPIATAKDTKDRVNQGLPYLLWTQFAVQKFLKKKVKVKKF